MVVGVESLVSGLNASATSGTLFCFAKGRVWFGRSRSCACGEVECWRLRSLREGAWDRIDESAENEASCFGERVPNSPAPVPAAALRSRDLDDPPAFSLSLFFCACLRIFAMRSLWQFIQ